MSEQQHLVIHGVDEQGRRLRPGDWIERISSTLAQFGADNRLIYSQSVKPCFIDGQKCLVVARCLEHTDPAAYAFIMEFARSNRLCVQIDRRNDGRALTCPAPTSETAAPVKKLA